jgi:hypothetical protein
VEDVIVIYWIVNRLHFEAFKNVVAVVMSRKSVDILCVKTSVYKSGVEVQYPFMVDGFVFTCVIL